MAFGDEEEQEVGVSAVDLLANVRARVLFVVLVVEVVVVVVV